MDVSNSDASRPARDAAETGAVAQRNAAQLSQAAEGSGTLADSLIDSASDCIEVLDLQGKLLSISRGGLEVMAIADLEAVRGTPWCDFWQGSDRVAAEAALAAARVGGVGRFAGRCALRSGPSRWWDVAVTAANGLDGEPSRLLVVSRDITAHKRSEHSLRFLVEAGRILSSSLDYETTLEQVAKACVPFLADCCLVDILGEQGDWRRITAVHGDPALTGLMATLRKYPAGGNPSSLVNRVTATGEPVLTGRLNEEELRSRCQSEEHFQVARLLQIGSMICIPLPGQAGALGAITLIYSASGRLHSSGDLELAEMLSARAALAIEHSRSAKQLAESAQRLRDADRAKDLFLGTLAHELRNPLSAIRTATELLGPGNPRDATLQRVKEVVQRQVDHTARLVEDLLDVSRISQGKITLRRDRVDLAQVIRRAAEACEHLFEQKKQRLLLRLPPQPVWVEGDDLRLVQVVSNLLSNAARYTPAAGYTSLALHARENRAVVSVRDNGIGIPKEMLQWIFEPYSQLDDHNTQRRQGLGLGLTLVRRLVELHGGSVRAHSDGLERGSEFVVELPLAAAAQVAPPSGHGARTPARVLLVDDNSDHAEMLGELIELWGYEVLVAADAMAGVRLGREYQPDVVLLDLGLPGVSGAEVLRQLRADPGTADARVIAVASFAGETERTEALVSGFDHCLAKPLRPAALRKLLDQVAPVEQYRRSAPAEPQARE